MLRSRGTAHNSYGRKRISVAWKCSLLSKEVLRVVCEATLEHSGGCLRFPLCPGICVQNRLGPGGRRWPKPPQRAIFWPRNGLSLPCIHINLGALRSADLAQMSSLVPGIKRGGELLSLRSAAPNPDHTLLTPKARLKPCNLCASSQSTWAHTTAITSHSGSHCYWGCRAGLG